MELKTFVSETLCQIAEGLSHAQKETAALGVVINPPLYMNEHGTQINHGNKQNFVMQSVAFDLSVVVTAVGNTGGKAKICIAMLGIEGGKDTSHSSSSQSRITFSIPVSWPPACAPEQDAGTPSVLRVRDSRWEED